MGKWRRHTEAFKRQAVERMKTAENIQALARELGVERKLLYIWKDQFLGRSEPPHANLAIAPEERKEKQLQEQVAKLQASLSRKVVENDFLKSALLRVEQDRQTTNVTGASASSAASGCGRKSRASREKGNPV